LSTTAAVNGFDFDRATERLVDLALVDIQQIDLASEPRYVLHPLVRAFAGSQLAKRPDFEQEARERWIGWYVDLSSQVGYCWDDLSRLSRLDSEQSNIRFAFSWSSQNHQYDSQTNALVKGASYYYHVRGLWDVAFEMHQERYNAARRLGDNVEEAEALALYTHMLCKREHFQDVELHLQCLREIMSVRRVTMLTALDWKRAELAYWSRHGDFEKAEEAILQEVNLCNTDLTTQNNTLYKLAKKLMLGSCFYNQGKIESAKHIYVEILPRVNELGSQPAPLAIKARLAAMALMNGNVQDATKLAKECYEYAIIYQDKRVIAEIQYTVARLHIAHGDLRTAHSSLLEAIDLFERMGMRRAFAEGREELARLEAQMAEAAE